MRTHAGLSTAAWDALSLTLSRIRMEGAFFINRVTPTAAAGFEGEEVKSDWHRSPQHKESMFSIKDTCQRPGHKGFRPASLISRQALRNCATTGFQIGR
jgi:hypothetical protein